ncbi:MAG TPA: hypothetical protein VEP90_24515, partial [Methylomirabilota bacterium]|nr:hypothetical protein [Methylomirabilota bacterium]
CGQNGLALGVQADGTYSSTDYCLVAGNSFEDNGRGIFCRGVKFSLLTGNNIHAETTGQPVNSFGGLRLEGCDYVTCSNMQIYGDIGSNSNYFVNIDPGNPSAHLLMENIHTFLSGSGALGSNWNVAANCDVQFLNCPDFTPGTQTFANAPSAPSDGAFHVFTDSTEVAGSSTAIGGGGTHRVMARYSGNDANWYVVSKA